MWGSHHVLIYIRAVNIHTQIGERLSRHCPAQRPWVSFLLLGSQSCWDCGVLLGRLFIYLCGFLQTLKPPSVLIRTGRLQSLAMLQRTPERREISVPWGVYSLCCVESFHLEFSVGWGRVWAGRVGNIEDLILFFLSFFCLFFLSLFFTAMVMKGLLCKVMRSLECPLERS